MSSQNSSETNSDKTLFGLRMALDELKRHHERTNNNIDTIRETGRTIIGTASIGLPLLSAARLIIPGKGFLPDIIRPPVIIVAALGYIALMVLCLKIVSPLLTYGPLNTSQDEVDTFYTGREEKDILPMLVQQYLKIATFNQLATIKLVRKVRWAIVLLIIDTVLLLILL